MDLGLTGRTALVPGASFGLGLASAVGQAYKKFIKTQRLLNDDQSWLKVVS